MGKCCLLDPGAEDSGEYQRREKSYSKVERSRGFLPFVETLKLKVPLKSFACGICQAVSTN